MKSEDCLYLIIDGYVIPDDDYALYQAGKFKVLDSFFQWRRTPKGEAWANHVNEAE